MMAFAYTLIVLLVITSVLLTMLVLLHRGKGGGLSSMFGGGVSSSLAGSSVAEKNLDRYTVLVGIIWFACFVGLGLWLKVAMATGGSYLHFVRINSCAAILPGCVCAGLCLTAGEALECSSTPGAAQWPVATRSEARG